MIFREMMEEDISKVVALEEKCFKEPWNEKDCLNELNENPFSHGWLLIDEEVVGYAFLWETFEMAQLARIGVDPQYRKKGYGNILLNELFQRASSQECEFMTLEVRESNVAARHLYEKNEFVQVNISKKYYPDGEDAVVYTRAL